MQRLYDRWVEPMGRLVVAVVCQMEVIAIVHGILADRQGKSRKIPTISRMCFLLRPWGIPVRQRRLPLGYLVLTVPLAWLNFHIMAEKPRTLRPMGR